MPCHKEEKETSVSSSRAADARALVRALKALLIDDQGQATVEYILILGMVTTVAVSLTRAILGALDRGVLSLGAQLEKDLKTGRVQISVWKN